MTELEQLFKDWIEAEVAVIGEFSSSFAKDYGKLIDHAKERSAKLGLAWSDDIVPPHVWSIIEDARLDGSPSASQRENGA